MRSFALSGLVVLRLSAFLPPLVTGPFFHAGLLERPQPVDLLEVIRQLFSRLNRLVTRIIPFGIFALTALNSARADAGGKPAPQTASQA